jgi:ABC-type amino acid transport system permease subunit
MNEYLFGYIILTIYGVAHMAISHQDMREKIVRANNAALSLGMGTYVRLYRIILPLVLHQNWWVFYNEAIFLFKNIAILSVIAIPELVATAKHIVNDTYLAINTYVTIAIICLFLVASMKGAFIVLHKLLFKH